LNRAPAPAWEHLQYAVAAHNPPEDVIDVLLLRAESERRAGDLAASAESVVRACAAAEVTPNVARAALRARLSDATGHVSGTQV
jgi:hypothetical protein